jgi:hypothetical protein
LGAGRVDGVDGNNDGRRGGLQSGDDGVGVWADAVDATANNFIQRAELTLKFEILIEL